MDRYRWRYIFGGIIIITLPFYCIGFLLYALSPRTPDAASLALTPTATSFMTFTPLGLDGASGSGGDATITPLSLPTQSGGFIFLTEPGVIVPTQYVAPTQYVPPTFAPPPTRNFVVATVTPFQLPSPTPTTAFVPPPSTSVPAQPTAGAPTATNQVLLPASDTPSP